MNLLVHNELSVLLGAAHVLHSAGASGKCGTCLRYNTVTVNLPVALWRIEKKNGLRITVWPACARLAWNHAKVTHEDFLCRRRVSSDDIQHLRTLRKERACIGIEVLQPHVVPT